jgi:RecG-like helicase
MAQHRRRSALGRLGDRLTQTVSEMEADELMEDATKLGATPIKELADREVASVCGSVRAVTLPPKKSVPALVVDLYDGSKSLNLVWLGRRSIGGIEPGTFLKAHGRVTFVKGTPTIFNPAYEILPSRGH